MVTISTGITHLHHFYFRRNVDGICCPVEKCRIARPNVGHAFVKFYAQGSCLGFTKMNRYQSIQYGRYGGSQVNRYFSGTLFVGSLISEVSAAYSMTHKLGRLAKLQMPGQYGQAAIACQSITS